MTHEPRGPGAADEHRPAPDPEQPQERGPSELAPEEEPTTTGTLFIMVLFLMAMAGMWAIMYFTLLNR